MAAEGLKLGGLSRAVAESLGSARLTSVEVGRAIQALLEPPGSPRCSARQWVAPPLVQAPKRVVCPTPRLPSFPRGCSSGSLQEEEAVVPRSSTSRNDTDLEDSVTELRRILEVDCTLDPDPVPFLGVSPPLRSGAANPLCQDSAWKLKAQQASRSSLEPLLQSIDRTRCSAAAPQCRGDYRLLFSPAEYGLGLLACDGADAQQGVQHRGGRRLVPHSWRTASLSPA